MVSFAREHARPGRTHTRFVLFILPCLWSVLSYAAEPANPSMIFDWGFRTRYQSGSTLPPAGMFFVPHPSHDYGVLHWVNTQTYQYNFSSGYPISIMLRDDTGPYSGATDDKRNTLQTTMDWLHGQGMQLDYVFADFESANAAADTTTMVQQVRAYSDPKINSARVVNYANYPGASDPSQIWPSSVNRTTADSFYQTSGQNVAMPNAYPYSSMIVHTWSSQWGTNVAPNQRSALFWAPLERVSVAKRALPAGHQLIPWMCNFVSQTGYTAPTPTREDNVALLRHVRLRGADGFYSLYNLSDKLYGWQDLDYLFAGTGTTTVLNLATHKTSGFQWSGISQGDGVYKNVSFALSNLGNSAAAITLPTLPGVPTTSPAVPAGVHYAADYINDPGSVGSGTITIGRDGILHGLFVNRSVTLNNAIEVDANGTGTVTIGSDLSGGGFAATFAGALTLGRAVTLQGAGDGTMFTGKISGNAGTLTVSGGRVTLSNSGNNFVGDVVVSSGSILQTNAATVLPATASVAVDGTLQLNAGSTQGIDALSGSGTVKNGDGNALLTVGNNGGSGTFSGSLSDGASYALSVAKNGSGTQILTGNNTHSGGTTIAAGTLQIGDGGVSGSLSGDISIADGASLVFDRSDDSSYSGVITGDGDLVKTGSGKLTLAQPLSYSGNTIVEAGTLNVPGLSNAGSTTIGTSTTTAVLITEHIHQDTLTIHAGSKVKIGSMNNASSTSVVNFLNIWNPSTNSFTWSDDNTDGFTSARVRSGGDGNTSAVPEPATWLLIIVAAMTGYCAIRHRC